MVNDVAYRCKGPLRPLVPSCRREKLHVRPECSEVRRRAGKGCPVEERGFLGGSLGRLPSRAQKSR
jgi:hypothetical protein